MASGDDFAERVSSCGGDQYCCQSSNLADSCCDNSGQDGNEFALASVLKPTVLPKKIAPTSASILFSTVEVSPSSTIIMTKSVTVWSSNQAFSSRNTSSSSTTQTPTKPPTPNPTNQPEQSLSTTQPPTKPRIPGPTHQPGQSSKAEPTSKGLIVALGLTAGILAIAALVYALRRSRKRRRLKKQEKDASKRKVRDRPPAFTPPLVETNGYTEWEMATNGNTHEAPASATWPESERGRRYTTGVSLIGRRQE
ncbi:MAG: hypothetical protein LQ350_003226 [Teloschistes chrysophthalmus]|nr:MAG: hypothetical protein LQ350_003226 [Niorma chrysophthalma]